jgi:ATP-binding cassette, subfamily B (MDR/TAP), member 9
LTSGQLVSFLLYLSSLSDAFSSLGWIFSSLTQAVGAADKVFELLNRQPRISSPSRTDVTPSPRTGILGIEATRTSQQRNRGLRPENVRGEIEFKNVTLYYPARPQRRVLNELSLKIEPGSIVALVGQSGGGKSSVMSLIQHLYEQSGGQVLIDGTEVHELCPSWLSRHVCIVSQEPTLFGRSIGKNIMYGLEGTTMEPSQEEIEEAARLANADAFIQKMPQKYVSTEMSRLRDNYSDCCMLSFVVHCECRYDTEVGERGVQLSGGQKQRIAIARALVRRPRVLLCK